MRTLHILGTCVVILLLVNSVGFGQTNIFHDRGNVGIGTREPQEKLEVAGRIKSGALTIGPWPPNSNRYVFFGTNTLDQTQTFNYALMQDGNQGRTLVNSPEELHFLIKDESKMMLANNGNVGIGTRDPGVYKLSVNGAIRAKEIVVEAGGADFVFEDDYPLMPLNDLERHINVNKHLPDIPSARDVEENGVSLGEMQVKLLQKVEELTLYVIDQDKKLNVLEKENELLKKRISLLEEN